jgi:hypothetical protein
LGVLGEDRPATPSPQDESTKHNQSLLTGLAAVAFACWSSALAGVYSEKVVKKKDYVRDRCSARQLMDSKHAAGLFQRTYLPS